MSLYTLTLSRLATGIVCMYIFHTVIVIVCCKLNCNTSEEREREIRERRAVENSAKGESHERSARHLTWMRDEEHNFFIGLPAFARLSLW